MSMTAASMRCMTCAALLLSCTAVCCLLLTEGDLTALATAALESGQAMSAEEQMLMQASGAYGAGAMVGGYGTPGGSAGGILDNQGSSSVPEVTTPAASTGLEAGNQDTTSTTPAKPATTAAPASTTKSAASPAAKSTGLAVAGVMIALSAFLL